MFKILTKTKIKERHLIYSYLIKHIIIYKLTNNLSMRALARWLNTRHVPAFNSRRWTRLKIKLLFKKIKFLETEEGKLIICMIKKKLLLLQTMLEHLNIEKHKNLNIIEAHEILQSIYKE